MSLLPFAGTDSRLLAARTGAVRLLANGAAREGLRVVVEGLAHAGRVSSGGELGRPMELAGRAEGIGVADWSSCRLVSPCKSDGLPPAVGPPAAGRGRDPDWNPSASAPGTQPGLVTWG